MVNILYKIKRYCYTCHVRNSTQTFGALTTYRRHRIILIGVRAVTNEEKILDLLGAMNNRIGNIEIDIAGIKTDVAGTKTDIAGMKVNIAELQSNVAEIRMDVENRVDPQLQALAEGQKTILETLAPKNRVEALEEEVDFMKHVMNSLAREVDDLKKAN